MQIPILRVSDLFSFTHYYIIMKRFFTTFVCAALAALSMAQSYPTNGYYRVKNKKTSRYIYVSDNVGSIQMSSASADLGALRLFKDKERRISDPGSVIYMKVVDNGAHKYDAQSQGTGVYSMIQHYLQLSSQSGGFWIYAQQGSIARYLADEFKSNSSDEGQMGIKNTGDYRIWTATPVSSSSDEYFGIKPLFESKGKYYYPFYAAFPFKFASSGMKAYYISVIDAAEGVAVMKEYTEEVKAGGVPYIIECSSMNTTDNRLDILTSGGTVPTNNKLAGNYFFNPDHYAAGTNAYKEFDKNKMRMLEVSASGQLQFVNTSSRFETYEDYPGKLFLPANQSYLVVPNGTPATLNVVLESEWTGISAVMNDNQDSEAIYSLTGERVATGADALSELPAGIYVIGGRKVQIR